MHVPPIEIRALGALAIRGADEAILRRRKPLALLVYLLLGSDDEAFHQRDSLAALFWPGSSQARARTSLRQAISVIDACLDNVVERRGHDEIRVAPGRVAIDVLAFDDAIAAGDWRRALLLYRGPFFDGVHVTGGVRLERWIDNEQLRLMTACRRALDELARAGGDAFFTSDLGRELSARAPDDTSAAVALVRWLETEGSEHPAGASPPAGSFVRPAISRRSTAGPRMAAAAVAIFALGLLGQGRRSADSLTQPPATSIRVAVPALTSVGPTDPSVLHALSLIVGEEVERFDSVFVLPYHEGLVSAGDVDVVVRGTSTGDGDVTGLVLDVIDVASGKAVGGSIRSTRADGDLAWLARDAGRRAATRLVGHYLPPAEIRGRGNYALHARPPYLAAYIALSESLSAFAAGDVPGAEAHARRALSIDPDFIAAKLEVATYRLNSGDPRAARSLAHDVRRSETVLSGVDRRQLAWLEAVLAGDRAARLEAVERGFGEQTAYQLAYELSGMGRLRDALAVLDEDERAGSRAEFQAREAWLRVRLHHLLGDHERELDSARRYRSEFPRSAQAVRLEAGAMVAAGRIDEVVELFSSLDESAFDAPYLEARLAHEIGLELLAHGDEVRALEWLNRSIGRYPDLIGSGEPTEMEYARALMAAGAWADARRAYQSLRQRFPDRVEIVASLAVVEARDGDLSSARQTYAELADKGPSDWMPGWALRTEWRARLAAALGYDDEVVDLLRMAVARGAARPAWIHAYPEWRFLADRSDLDAWLTP